MPDQSSPAMRLASRRLGPAFGDVELAYVEWGRADAARTIVCVHGLTRNARDFDPLASALAARGARVLAIDVAGRGRSFWLPDPEHYTVPVYALQIMALLQSLEIGRIDWIGTSMGGLIGMAIAITEHSPIDRLVSNDIAPFVPASSLQAIAGYLALDLYFPDMAELEAHLRVIHAGFGPLDDAQWRHLATHSARPDGTGFRLAYDPAIAVPFRAAATEDIDLWAHWPKVGCPVLMIRGADSLLLSRAALARALERPGTDSVTFAGCGHAPALMARDQIDAIVTWLKL